MYLQDGICISNSSAAIYFTYTRLIHNNLRRMPMLSIWEFGNIDENQNSLHLFHPCVPPLWGFLTKYKGNMLPRTFISWSEETDINRCTNQIESKCLDMGILNPSERWTWNEKKKVKHALIKRALCDFPVIFLGYNLKRCSE